MDVLLCCDATESEVVVQMIDSTGLIAVIRVMRNANN